MERLGNGEALQLEDFAKVKNAVEMRLGDQDNMVTETETRSVADAIEGANFELLENTPHPLPQIKTDVLVETIKKTFLD